MSYITLAGHPPTSDILDTLHGSFVITGWNFTQKKLLLNGLDFSSFLVFGCSSKRLVLICFSCGVLYEIFTMLLIQYLVPILLFFQNSSVRKIDG
mgnify:FL=1|jgi:hypothetical protein